MRKSVKWSFLTLGTVALVAIVVRSGPRDESVQSASHLAAAPTTGYRLPTFTLAQYPGNQTISTTDFAGKPVFINFWASWCTYCKLESPDLVQAYKKYGHQVLFVSIDATAQDSPVDMARFVQHYDITWPVALDTTGQVMQDYSVVGLPTSFFVNRAGVIVDAHAGAISAADLDAELRRISQ